MSNEFEDYHVKQRSFQQCEQAGQQLRISIGCFNDERVPHILETLSRLNLGLLVRSAEAMNGASALALPDQGEIHFREDVFHELIDDKPSARFDALHELAHVSFHKGQRGQTRFFKMTSGNVLLPFVVDDHSVEEQADRIARAVLMPEAMVEKHGDVRNLCNVAGAPLNQGGKRIYDLEIRKAGTVSADTHINIARLKSSNPTSKAQQSKLKAEELKHLLWSKLPLVSGEDPAKNRRCGPYRVVWSDFGKITECGWFIEDNQVISYFASKYR